MIAPFYDDDMGRNVSDEDVHFYIAQCRNDSDVLELGCGTGRVTLPLVKSGRTVLGIDSSAPMLEILRSKAQTVLSPNERRRLNWHQADMSDYRGARKFDAIICPYSAFTYLVSDGSRDRALGNVRHNLASGGKFILDVFVPHKEYGSLPNDYVFHDYERRLSNDTVLKRTKTIQQDRQTRINVITRHYEFVSPNGAARKELTTVERIRTYEPNELRSVLEKSGFQIRAVFADFRDQPHDEDTRMIAFICEAAS